MIAFVTNAQADLSQCLAFAPQLRHLWLRSYDRQYIAAVFDWKEMPPVLLQVCFERNVHGRTRGDIEAMAAAWEPVPPLFQQLDASALLSGGGNEAAPASSTAADALSAAVDGAGDLVNEDGTPPPMPPDEQPTRSDVAHSVAGSTATVDGNPSGEDEDAVSPPAVKAGSRCFLSPHGSPTCCRLAQMGDTVAGLSAAVMSSLVIRPASIACSSRNYGCTGIPRWLPSNMTMKAGASRKRAQRLSERPGSTSRKTMADRCPERSMKLTINQDPAISLNFALTVLLILLHDRWAALEDEEEGVNDWAAKRRKVTFEDGDADAVTAAPRLRGILAVGGGSGGARRVRWADGGGTEDAGFSIGGASGQQAREKLIETPALHA